MGADFSGIPENGTLLGDAAAPATLVDLPSLLDEWVRPGRLRLDLRLLTFIGPDSPPAARAAGAAALRDRLWPFAELFFLNQGKENSGYVTLPFLSAIGAATPGLDEQRALDARDSAAVTAQLKRAQASCADAPRLGRLRRRPREAVRPARPSVEAPAAYARRSSARAVRGSMT